jgi:POT family proton-dependent oligopeptide transporter
VILFAPWFSALWLRLAKQGREPGTAIKFTIAIGQIALAFLVLALGISLTGGAGKVPLAWFVLNFLFLVLGELCLAPVGLSMVTKLAPARIVGVMMGTFFLAYSASSFIAGLIARFTSAPTNLGQAIDLTAAKGTYATVFSRLGLMALAVAVVLGLLSPILGRLTRPVGSEQVAPG